MNGNHNTLLHDIAQQRTAELRLEAQRDRFFAELGRQNGVPSPIDRVRLAVGSALVRAGNLVGGDRSQRQLPERLAGAAILRMAR